VDGYAHHCHTDYHAFHHSGTRPNSKVKWIVMHSTEGGGSAKNVAKYFSSSKSGGSAHLVVDDNACYRCLANNEVPWGAPGANEGGFHIEQVGYASWSGAQWEQHTHMLHRAAYKAALHCKLFRLPARFVTAAGLKKGLKGITTHAEVSKAFPNNAGNHHDPGSGWPRALFLALVKHYLSTL
jgi:hypothetical protein